MANKPYASRWTSNNPSLAMHNTHVCLFFLNSTHIDRTLKLSFVKKMFIRQSKVVITWLKKCFLELCNMFMTEILASFFCFVSHIFRQRNRVTFNAIDRPIRLDKEHRHSLTKRQCARSIEDSRWAEKRKFSCCSTEWARLLVWVIEHRKHLLVRGDIRSWLRRAARPTVSL